VTHENVGYDRRKRLIESAGAALLYRWVRHGPVIRGQDQHTLSSEYPTNDRHTWFGRWRWRPHSPWWDCMTMTMDTWHRGDHADHVAQ
jgi:hypothetical protein